MKNIITKSLLETKTFARKMAQEFLASERPRTGALVIGLEGDLGGGKTTFVQGFAKELGVKEKILSPTFVILKKFEIPKGKFKTFYHIDCYRINAQDILNLEFDEIISNSKNIIIIEWADKIKKILPEQTIILKFDFIDEETREIEQNF